jgi:membrane protease YdiL (CAAX protease family)
LAVPAIPGCNQTRDAEHLQLMNRKMLPAVAGLALAIAITTAMDATGYSTFSALPLFPLAGLFWYLQKASRAEIGLAWGPGYAYGLAIAWPVAVLGGIGLVALLAGAVDTSDANWHNARLNMIAGSTVGALMVMLTEEGFFRGWLWAALRRAGKSDNFALVWTSVAFTAWHISAISLDTGFDVPANEIPIYLVNATLLGLIWGYLRLLSGSIVVAAVCHAVWNAFAYSLYGFGERTGVLGIEETHIFGPEVGLLGIVFNLAFFAAIYYQLSWKRK